MLCFGMVVFLKITLYYKYLFTPLKYLKQFHFHCIMNIILQINRHMYVCLYIYSTPFQTTFHFPVFQGLFHTFVLQAIKQDLTWESQGCRIIRSFCLDRESRKYLAWNTRKAEFPRKLSQRLNERYGWRKFGLPLSRVDIQDW